MKCIRHGTPPHSWFTTALILVLALPQYCGAVVITEIAYNPPEATLEFLELSNDTTTPQDISGYAFTEGIFFIIPPATILRGGESLVICADVDAVREHYGIENAIGNYTGKLDGSGERLTLVDHAGLEVQSLRYRTAGKWPVKPDGTGHTLSLRLPYLDSSEPENWLASAELGGTPGRRNFPRAGEEVFESIELIPASSPWRYRKGTAAFSSPPDAWRAPEFDDSEWPEGEAGFGFGDDDDATLFDDMRSNYATAAIRRTFEVNADDLEIAGVQVTLGMIYDDGFCAFVNGVEAASDNCPEPATWDSSSDGSHEARGEDLFFIDNSLLRPGTNTIAIQGHNASVTSNDFSLHPRLFLRHPPIVAAGGPPRMVFNELFRGDANDGWVELYNPAPYDSPLADFVLTDNPARPDPVRFPAGVSIPSKGFLVVGEAESGLDLSSPTVQLFLIDGDGNVVTASTFDRPLLENEITSEVRFPDGGSLDWVTPTMTPGAPNEVERTTDIVINEVFYNPPDGRDGEFLELFNRGDSAVDLAGFRFTKGIDFTFIEGTSLPAGEFLVLARKPETVREIYGIDGVFGPYEGGLSNRGERLRLEDRRGNMVDSVRYHDEGDWSSLADGGGSSLELIDPWQDNSSPSAWEASDERGKAEWTLLEYNVEEFRASQETELHLYLGARGSCLLDEVSILREGVGENFIPNPGFETSTAPWLLQGTHVYSRRITDDSFAGDACLEIIASGKGDTLVNRIETNTAPRMSNGEYTVSFYAKWQGGTNLLIVHGEYTPGRYCCAVGPSTNLSGNAMARRFFLPIPARLGSPGETNGVRIRLMEETGTANLGPVIDSVTHLPPAPAANRPVDFKARISDAQGVASARLHYRLDDANGEFLTVPLVDDGSSADEAAGDGIYSSRISSGFALRQVVVYYIEATDMSGVVRRYPVDAPERTLALMPQEGVTGENIDTYSIVLDAAAPTRIEQPTAPFERLGARDVRIQQRTGLLQHRNALPRQPMGPTGPDELPRPLPER